MEVVFIVVTKVSGKTLCHWKSRHDGSLCNVQNLDVFHEQGGIQVYACTRKFKKPNVLSRTSGGELANMVEVLSSTLAIYVEAL